jgi:cystathionine beta-lyase
MSNINSAAGATQSGLQTQCRLPRVARNDGNTGKFHNPLEQYTLQELRQRTSEKWQEYPNDVLPLWVAEMDNELPEPIKQALVNALNIGDTGYLSMPCFKNYKQSLADFATRHWNWTPDTDKMFYVTDVVSGIRDIIETYLGDDDQGNVITSTPIYPPFTGRLPKGYNLIDAPLTRDGSWRLDLQHLEQVFEQCNESGHKSVYLLCNPHNPTGTVHTFQELEKLSNLAKQYNILVISDEIHAPLVSGEEQFIPFQLIPRTQSITVTSCSKTFSIPGLKCALAVTSNDELHNLLHSSSKIIKGGGEHLSVLAQTTGYNNCDEWLEQLHQALRSNILYFAQLQKQYFPKAIYTPTFGTYFAWVDFSPYFPGPGIGATQPEIATAAPRNDESGSVPSEYFLEKAKVAVNPGASFAGDCKNFVRVNLATSKSVIELACKKIATSLSN